jgi:hypothetical protein
MARRADENVLSVAAISWIVAAVAVLVVLVNVH